MADDLFHNRLASYRGLNSNVVKKPRKWPFAVRLKDLLIFIFVCYAIALFVPSTDAGYYFEFRYGLDGLINRITWNVLLASVLIMSAVKILTRSMSVLESVLLFAGMFFILYNQVLVLGGSTTDFNHFGFLLLTSLAIFEADEEFLAKAVALALILIALGTLLTIVDGYFGLQVSPIVATIYASLASGSDDLMITNSSFFGQNSAAGAAIAFGLLFILLHISRQKSGFYLVVYIIGFITLLSTFSMGPITVSIAGLLLYWKFAEKNAQSTFLIILFLVFIGAIFYSFDLSTYLEYKGASGFMKYERAIAFFEAIFSNPLMLILGEKIGLAHDSNFYTESSFLNIWLDFGLAGALFLTLIAAFGLVQAVKIRDPFAVYVVLLLFVLVLTQTSALMPANVIILLVIYGKLYREARLQSAIASNLGGDVVSQA